MNYVCEHLGFAASENIPNEYDDEFDELSRSILWPKDACIVLKSCTAKPIEKFIFQDIIATTEHLALVRKHL